jgi:hypothetical protein
MSVDQYNVSVSIYRNRTWTQEFRIYDESGSPIDVSNDALALVVFPSYPVGSAPLITNSAPNVSVNVVTFTTSDNDTGRLTAAQPYTWQALRHAYGAPSGQTIVTVAGALNVFDSPPFP